ncbi:flavodoxin family protein [Alkalibaculum sp. M08DMB]|uniref:Flavodoxin family protein n=1 Tax=Alkalibaculum sporogenes TaxID=2655001 RepID=A0A6A7K5Q3_9FIRM|nr:flavodoxin family protein [Alkalibaculum sporogenes]MPW24730.1 flavodoxin family protein [Alkalibaculum sporogenes]
MGNFKVMGITAGRKDGNSEILLKEALNVCEGQGAEVIMVNLHDYHILDCVGCEACTQGMARGVQVPCILKEKDDKDILTTKMLDMDAVIFSIPTYDLMPCSKYLTFAHRNLAYEASFLQEIGAIQKKDRVAGIICVGGSTRSWQSMALEAMSATLFTTSFLTVDQMMAMRISRPAYALIRSEYIERAHVLGENIMKSLKTPATKREWLGDKDFGWCPNCHSNALVKGEVQWDGIFWPVECQVCGAGGTLEQDEKGDYQFVIAENGLVRDRTTDEGRAHHLREIGTGMKFFYEPENQAIVKQNIGKYKNKKFPTIEK